MEWRELFAKNCAEMSAFYRGNHAAQPSINALSAQKRAWERVVEVDNTDDAVHHV